MTSTSVVPDLDDLVAPTGGQEFSATAGWRWFLVAGNAGQMGICSGWSKSNTFQHMFVPKTGNLCFAGVGVPDPWYLIIACAHQPPTIYRRCYRPDPISVALQRLEAITRRYVPYAQRLVS